MAFHQLREHITAAIHGVEGPELSAIVDYHVRAAVANNNLVARSFLTEELGYKVMFLTGVAKGVLGPQFLQQQKSAPSSYTQSRFVSVIFGSIRRPLDLASHT